MLKRLKDESGIALVLALTTMTVMTIAATTGIYYATSSQHESYFSKASSTAYRLAQSGLNNAMATLGSSQANAMSQTALPTSEATASQYSYPSGTAEWWGVYNSGARAWTLYGKGIVPNPVSSSAPVTREVQASMSVTYSYSQPVNVQAWNYVYLTNVGGPNVCDVTTNEDVDIDAPLYIYGNLCFRNNSHIREDMFSPRIPISVSVIGKVQWAKDGYNNNGWGNGWNNDWWGSSIGMNPDDTVSSVYVGGGCGDSLTNVHTCTTGGWNGWNWSKDPIYPGSGGFSTSPPAVTPPVVNWTTDGWYQSASPGPLNPCTTVSGTPPAFDGGPAPNDTQQNLTAPYANGSLPSTVNLTPTGVNASYTCKTVNGELSWNAQTEVLTVKGVIYVDGNVTIGDGAVDQYVGQATLYVSGYVKVNGRMCGIRKSNWVGLGRRPTPTATTRTGTRTSTCS